MGSNIMNLTCERLKRLLDYNPETGVFRWKVGRGPKRVGDVAGCLDNGYVYICIDGHNYLAHRLAWLYQFGFIGEDHIDHSNLKRDDNRISNLRLANHSKNRANSAKQPNNTSGFKGVVKKANRWRAQITCNNKTRYLGSFATPTEAHAAYLAAATAAFGEFARAA